MSINITLTRNNESYIIKGSNPDTLGLISYDGFEASDYSQQINTDGAKFGGTLVGTKINPRNIDLDFALVKTGNEDNLREDLLSFFSPLSELEVIVERGNYSRRIKGYIDGFSISQKTLNNLQLASLSITCPYPFFLDMSDYGKDIAEVTPQFTPPYLMASTGQIMGIIKDSNQITIKNDGDLEVGFIAEFTAKAAVTNIRINNVLTSEYVRVIDSMVTGDKIIISAIDGKKTITKNGVNNISNLDRTSTFFKIAKGTNVISYTADTGSASLIVRLTYTPIYFGI